MATETRAPEAEALGRSSQDAERYEVLRLLGRGGFGEVYLARYRGRQGFSRLVALKVLRPDVGQQEELARRVRDEARLLGLVHHRAVVGVDRLIQLQGRWCVVMEFVDGVSLDALTRVGPLPLGAALQIGAEICRALHTCAETCGPDGAPLSLLHRDIKPSNILLTRHGDVKLLDFGIAFAAFDERESETRSMVFGTPGYMAPERFELRCGPEADIYALGAVIFEVLTRRRFGRTSANPARHLAHVEARLQQLRELRPDVPGSLVELLAEVFGVEPEQRPSARALEERLMAVPSPPAEPGLMRWAAGAVDEARARVEVEETDTAGAAPSSTSWTGRVFTEDRSTLVEPVVAVVDETRLVALPVPAPRPRTSSAWGAPLFLLALLAAALLWRGLRPVPAPEVAEAPPAAPVAPPPVDPSPPAPVVAVEPAPAPPPVKATSSSGASKSARGSGKRRTSASCAAGEVLVEGVAGAAGEGIEVQSIAGWLSVPACVTWSPLLRVRRESSGIQVEGRVSLSGDRDRIAIACDPEQCRGDYNK